MIAAWVFFAVMAAVFVAPLVYAGLLLWALFRPPMKART